MEFNVFSISGNNIFGERKNYLKYILSLSDQYMKKLYPSEETISLERYFSKNVKFVLVDFKYEDKRVSEIIGCGALVLSEIAEIKKIFIQKFCRSLGHGKRIMKYIEELALSEGIRELFLEVGPKQPEAITLYKDLGYRERGPYGNLVSSPHSIFMEKIL